VSAADVLTVVGATASVTEEFGCLTVDVPAADWLAAASALRDDQRATYTYFDWLSAYDDLDAGVAVVVRLWSPSKRRGVLLRTRVPHDDGVLPTLTGLWPGANWHERETLEMFGVRFEGHPNPIPLLLPDGFDAHPLRKDFMLASRVAKPWPGAKEPGESDRDLEPSAAPRRRRARPPGVPDPGSWGPAS